MKILLPLSLLLALPLLFFGCTHKKSLKIAASSTPHAEILEFVKPKLREQGVDLKIIVIDDYQLPNRMLADKEIDANYFQHIAFLNTQKKEYNYDFVVLTAVHTEPLGIYSLREKNLDKLKTGAKLALPSDPSNEKRALLLLQDLHLITLKADKSCLLDIETNPYKIEFKEMDAALLMRLLPDVDYAVIPGNYVLQRMHTLRPLVGEDSCYSDYENVVVIRRDDRGQSDINLLAKALHSSDVKEFIRNKYKDYVKVCQ